MGYTRYVTLYCIDSALQIFREENTLNFVINGNIDIMMTVGFCIVDLRDVRTVYPADRTLKSL